jgi:hypothetical protein
MHPTPQSLRLARLRVLRNRPAPDLRVSGALAQEQRRLSKASRAVGGVARAWDLTAPESLRARCEVVGLARGVLTVRIADDSTRFAVDRWLRAGGRDLLASRTPATLTRVRLVR